MTVASTLRPAVTPALDPRPFDQPRATVTALKLDGETMPANATYAEREELWLSDITAEAGPEAVAVEILMHICALMERVLEPFDVDTAMGHAMGVDDGEYPLPWRNLVPSTGRDNAGYWPLTERLYKLHGYARYGILPDVDDSEQLAPTERFLEKLIDETRSILSLNELAALVGRAKSVYLEDIIAIARGRHALDYGRPIDIRALALLGEVPGTRMESIIMSASSAFNPNHAGLVPAAQALRWLETRDGFYPSIWRDGLQTEDERLELPPARPMATYGTWSGPMSELKLAEFKTRLRRQGLDYDHLMRTRAKARGTVRT